MRSSSSRSSTVPPTVSSARCRLRSPLRSLALLLVAAVFGIACDATGPTVSDLDKIVYHDDGNLWVSVLHTSDAPVRAQAERHLHAIGSGWEVTALAVSPGGRYAAIGLWNPSQESSRQHEGRLMIFDIAAASTMHDYRKAEMTDLGSFTIADGAMFVFRLGWLSADELLIDMQPQTSWVESLPSNISIVVDAPTGVRSSIAYYQRSAPPPVTAPVHAAHTKYIHHLVDGVVGISGAPVRDLRSGLQGYGVFFSP
jgi:hypothetical protein